MSILEELWYGNIEPAEYDISPDKNYKEMLQLISRNEDKLLATMTDEQKELFAKYADCVREYQVMSEYLLFQNSFRLGGRMMLEVMRGGIGTEWVCRDPETPCGGESTQLRQRCPLHSGDAFQLLPRMQ